MPTYKFTRVRRIHSESRDAVYFIAPTSKDPRSDWRVVKVLEHGPYDNKRPASWRGPFATVSEARLAGWKLDDAKKAAHTPALDI